MGSHGRTGMQKMLLGSVAAYVLGTTELPVLIVKLKVKFFRGISSETLCGNKFIFHANQQSD